MNKSKLWTFIVGLVLSVQPGTAKTVVPRALKDVGPFQICAEHHRYFSGYETGSNSYTEYDTYVVRYGGKDYGFDAPNGMFENEKEQYAKFTEVYVIPSTPATIMVMVGDPNNTYFYYLIHEVNGTAQADFLSRGRFQPPGIAWLDANNGQPANFTSKSPDTLSAGTLLLLNSDCVLNVHTLEKHSLSDVQGVYFQDNKPVMLSPDQHIFVRLGERTNDGHDPVLVATDFISQRSTILPIDKKRMRCNDWSKLDYAWIDHHFLFTRGDDGNYTFTQRADFVPLPHHGEVIDQGGGECRYRILNAQADIVNMMADTLKHDFQAQYPTPDPKPWLERKPPCGIYIIDGYELELTKYDEASISASKPGAEALISRIGKRIDEQLATGNYDALFKD